jgi:methionyl-tRNA formyltransferase
MRIAFFGTPEIATLVLDELWASDTPPSHIITAPDRPVGRTQNLTPPPVKLWAESHDLPYQQPETQNQLHAALENLAPQWDLFVVFAYGMILPKQILDMPTYGTLNLHPSLLPLLRGPSPIRSAILQNQRTTGVTIIRMDEKMDHGPILAQDIVEIPKKEWPPYGREFDHTLVNVGAHLLTETIQPWCNGDIEPQQQAHKHATYCQKLTRQDGELHIDPYHPPTGTEASRILRIIRAFDGWPESFFWYNTQRIKIRSAHIDKKGTLRLTRIVPSGRQEMDFTSYFPS